MVTEEELITGVVFTITLVLVGEEEHPVFVIISEYEPATDEDAFAIAGLWVALGELKPGPVQLEVPVDEGPVSCKVLPLHIGLLLLITGVDGV